MNSPKADVNELEFIAVFAERAPRTESPKITPRCAEKITCRRTKFCPWWSEVANATDYKPPHPTTVESRDKHKPKFLETVLLIERDLHVFLRVHGHVCLYVHVYIAS